MSLVRFDAADRVAWQRGFEVPTRWLAPSCAGATADGGALVAPQLDGGSAEAALFRVDATGSLQWARRIHAEGTRITPTDVRELPGGDIELVAGEWEREARPQGRLVRLTADGMLESPCSMVDAFPLAEIGSAATFTDVTPRVDPVAGSFVVQNWGTRAVMTEASDACDCACGTSLPPAEVAPRTTPEPLRVHASGRLTWEAALPLNSCWFNLYRRDLAGLRAGDHGACLVPDLRLGEAWDPFVPPAGGAWFYLVTGESDAGEGPLGPDSLGALRALTGACP